MRQILPHHLQFLINQLSGTVYNNSINQWESIQNLNDYECVCGINSEKFCICKAPNNKNNNLEINNEENKQNQIILSLINENNQTIKKLNEQNKKLAELLKI